MSDETVSREMAISSCRILILEAAEMGVTDMAFSGGEPLLWSGLQEAVALASNSGMKTSLYSTGNAPEFKLQFERLRDAGLQRVMFSVFGDSENSHEEVTRVRGSFRKTKSAVDYCVGLGLDVEFHFVPMAKNHHLLRPVAEMAKKMGVERVSVLRLVPQGRGAGNDSLATSKQGNESLRKAILELRGEGFEIRTGSPYNVLFLNDNPKCSSGIDRLTISPELYAFPCDAFKQISCAALGVPAESNRLVGTELKKFWMDSPYLVRARNLADLSKETCRTCKHFAKCKSGCIAQKIHSRGVATPGRDPLCSLAKQF
jgi:pyrroloquinoline quinone biosynthesis protein E